MPHLQFCSLSCTPFSRLQISARSLWFHWSTANKDSVYYWRRNGADSGCHAFITSTQSLGVIYTAYNTLPAKCENDSAKQQQRHEWKETAMCYSVSLSLARDKHMQREQKHSIITAAVYCNCQVGFLNVGCCLTIIVSMSVKHLKFSLSVCIKHINETELYWRYTNKCHTSEKVWV